MKALGLAGSPEVVYDAVNSIVEIPLHGGGSVVLTFEAIEQLFHETVKQRVYRTASAILSKPTISDVVLVGLTDEEGIREMKEEGFRPLGWSARDLEELHHGTSKEDHQDRQAGGSEDEEEGR